MAPEEMVKGTALKANSLDTDSRLGYQSQVRVLMVGESLEMQGGIVSVQKLIIDNIAPGFTIQHLPTLVSSSPGERIAKSIAFLRAIASISTQLFQKKADLIHAHVSERGSAYRISIVLLVARLFRVPVVLHTHGSEFHTFYDSLPTAVKTFVRRAFKTCSKMIVLSDSWKSFYVRNLNLLPEQVVAIPNPVKIPSQVPSRAGSDNLKIVFLGRIGDRKGAFDLIKAFSLIDVSERMHAELILAGDGQAEAAQSLAAELNLSDSVVVLGWIDALHRDHLLSSADIFVLPSYNEGLPMAVLESMSWALPVLTTPVGGIPEVITNGDNGLLVQPGDIDQLSSALNKLIQNPSLRKALGSAARASIAPLGIDIYCSRLGRVYTDITSKNEYTNY